MVQDADFTTFVSLLDINGPDVQNVQELSTLWGQLSNEFAELGIEVTASYAVLGEVDFIVIYEAPSVETAFQAGVILERHGLDAQTMEVTPTDDFANLVQDM